MRADYDLRVELSDICLKDVLKVRTNMLAASRELDRCELLLVVFLKCRPKLCNEVGGRDSKRFDIYFQSFSMKSVPGDLEREIGVPAITSASLKEVSGGLRGSNYWTYLSWRCPFHERRDCG